MHVIRLDSSTSCALKGVAEATSTAIANTATTDFTPDPFLGLVVETAHAARKVPVLVKIGRNAAAAGGGKGPAYAGVECRVMNPSIWSQASPAAPACSR